MMNHEKQLEQHRNFLKDRIRLQIDFSNVDQSKGVPPPPFEKPFPENATRIDLPDRSEWKDLGREPFSKIAATRRSRRRFKETALTRNELAYLLWATRGIQRIMHEAAVYRTVPSGGCRHAFETYLFVLNVEGIRNGIYRYLPLENQLLLIREEEEADACITPATLGQSFCAQGAVLFIWTAIPYRMEWRYGLAAHKTCTGNTSSDS